MTTSLWNELLKIALLGTDRTAISPTLQQQLDQLGIDPALTTPEMILEAAILNSRMERAGRLLPTWDAPISIPEENPAEKQGTPALAKLLDKIIETEDDRLLTQLIEEMRQHNMVLPGSMLPQLLQKAMTNTAFGQLILPTLGTRGHWLAAQHSEWRLLTRSAEYLSWEEGKHPERLALLKYWRQEDPAVGLHLLESTWTTETLSHQKAFLKCLQINLSLADEDFLEQALDSRRKEIRTTAASLLVQIADSALVKRMFERAKSYLTIKTNTKSPKIGVELPDTPDKTLLRDGLDTKRQWHQGGLKASRLWQILTAVPPQYWLTHFDCTAKELLEIYVRSEWSQLLVQSAIDASLRFKDEEWTEVLLSFWMDHHAKQRWANLQISSLFQQLHELSYTRLVLKVLPKNKDLPEEDDPILDLLSVTHLSWDETLSQKILITLRSWIGEDQMRYWGGWYLKGVLKNAAYCAAPTLYEKMRRVWYQAGPVWTNWENEIEDFFEIYQQRHRIKVLLSKA